MINFNDLLVEYGVDIEKLTNHDPPVMSQRDTSQNEASQNADASLTQRATEQSYNTPSDTRQHHSNEKVNEYLSRLPQYWWWDCLLIVVATFIAVVVIVNLPNVLFSLACVIFSISKRVCDLVLAAVAIIAGILVIYWRINGRKRWRKRKRWI
jgi:hypothetical protein